MQIDEMRDTLRALVFGISDDESTGPRIALIPEPYVSSTCALRRDEEGKLGLLVQCPEIVIPKHRHFGIRLAKVELQFGLDDTPSQYLEIKCVGNISEGEFLDLVVAILQTADSLAETSTFAQAVVATIAKWAVIFGAANGETLSAPQAAGVIAELVTLKRILEATGDLSLDFWHGPNREPHDFVVNNHGLEVKAKVGSGDQVSINGFHQLWVEPCVTLHVALYRILTEGGPLSISSLEDEIVNMGVDLLDIRMKLASMGVTPRDELWCQGMQVQSLTMFPVTAFTPRIAPDSIRDEIASHSLANVSYSVSVSGWQEVYSSDPMHNWLRGIDVSP